MSDDSTEKVKRFQIDRMKCITLHVQNILARNQCQHTYRFVLNSPEQSSGLFDQPVAVEGKRRRKGIESFAITHEAKRPVLEYKGGSGTKLGDIARSMAALSTT